MNSMDKFSEMEWNLYQQSHTGKSINDMMINNEIECDGECTDCGCAELENEFISHPKDVSQARKETPVFSGVLNYFPDAIREVSQCSFVGNEQHNPGKPLHWDRSKSGDEKDALTRHLLEAGTIDTDGIRHSAKVAWRALANLQKEIENDRTV
tara:strand:+ start:3010 stop:3468 length:459 start_codon:yes stop_codon:yes gene_type:complete